MKEMDTLILKVTIKDIGILSLDQLLGHNRK